MRGLQALVERDLGLAGVGGLALIAAAAAFYFAGVKPAESERADLRSEAARVAHSAPPRSPAREEREALDAFYGHFGASSQSIAALRAVFDAAAVEGIAVDVGEYRVARERGSRLLRYQIVLPVKGSYPALRRFIARALNEVPGLALDDVSLKRDSVASGALEARVQLTLYLGSG